MSSNLRNAIENAINQHSAENGSDTPDFILAEYLIDCLAAFDKAITAREQWYGRYDKKAPILPVNKEFIILGNEPGYRKLGNEEEVKEGDETFGIFGQPWTQANRYQIGEKAGTVGGFNIWRRKND